MMTKLSVLLKLDQEKKEAIEAVIQVAAAEAATALTEVVAVATAAALTAEAAVAVTVLTEEDINLEDKKKSDPIRIAFFVPYSRVISMSEMKIRSRAECYLTTCPLDFNFIFPGQPSYCRPQVGLGQ